MPFDGTNFDFVLPTVARPTREATARERCDYLIDFLEALDPKRFALDSWATGVDADYINETNLAGAWKIEHKCGTTGCIAGWIASLWRTRNIYTAGAMIGLGPDEAYALFMPYDSDNADICCELGDCTPKQAAACVRHWRDTGQWKDGRCVEQGVIDWRLALGV